MENASKALLMASGVLLTMLIIVLLIFARGKIGKLFNNEDELKDLDDISEFNLQFTNYNRSDVYGYELISLANKVADYNNRHSTATGATNDERYTPIELNVKLNGQSDKFVFSTESPERTITSKRTNSYFYAYNTQPMIQSSVKNDIMSIIKNATGIESYYGNDKIARDLAKSINSLILSKNQLKHDNEIGLSDEQSKNIAVENYKRIRGISSNITYEQMVNELTANNSNIMKYYEFNQFKKAIFYCDNIDYDQVSTRVSSMTFIFSGKIE